MSALLQLAERCERATAADRELDATIYLTAFGDRPYGVITGNKHQITGVGTLSGYVEAYRDVLTADDALHDDVVPRYTASLDAAMTLVPTEWDWTAQTSFRKSRARANCDLTQEAPFKPEDWKVTTARAATPALALCAAALRALASAGEAGTATTTEIGVVHEHAAPSGETPND